MTAVILAHPAPVGRRSSSSSQKTLSGWPAPQKDEVSGDRPTPRSPAPRPAAGRPATGRHAAVSGDAAATQVLAGRYLLEERTVEGGMGEVWTAHDQKLGREVVVKRMNHSRLGDELSRKRFEQEAQIIGSVASPHVVEFLDYGVEDGVPFIVMERLVGDDLEKRLRRGRLRPEQCAALVEQVASALTAADAKGVVHRDIKPSNILLARQGDGADAKQIVKLLDFGIAELRVSTAVKTDDGGTVGSPEFMSPEQIEGGVELDGRSDLFSLASVLYTCITGRMPFVGTDFLDTVYLILSSDYVPATVLRPSLPPAVDDFFAIALAPDPDQRFATPSAMAAAFRAAIARPVVSSAPPARPARRASPLVREMTPRTAAALSVDPPALRSFGSRTRAALRAHLVAPLAKPREADLAPRFDRKSLLFVAAALLAVSGTATAIWQWSHEKTAFERSAPSEADTAEVEY